MSTHSNTIAVLMGGNSSEREVSLTSGNAVYNSLKNGGLKCFSFDWHGDNLDKLWDKSFDKAFIVLHGKGGEDGYIQQLLEERDIPYTGTGSIASKHCMNKNTTKEICATHNLPVANWQVLTTQDKNQEINISLPVAVKPTTEGSSIGISKVEKKSELQDAIDLAFTYDDEIIIERWITGSEYSVSIVDGEVLPVVEIEPANSFYDYEAKYKQNDTRYTCPATLNKEQTQTIQSLALQVFDITGMKDWGRVDFMKDAQDNFYILEVNTVPGMTSHSLVPTAAKQHGMDFDTLVKKIALMQTNT